MDDLVVSVKNQVQVAMNISKNVLLNEPNDSNFVFSPLSMQVVLGIVAAGTKGATLDQMLRFLNSKSVEELNAVSAYLVFAVIGDGSTMGGPKLSAANGVWVDNSMTLQPSFKEVVLNLYNAFTNQVDFQTKSEELRNEVNGWADKETNGLVKEVLPPNSVSSNTRLILANALYFKGLWKQKFDASKTQIADFHLSNNGGSIRVPFMTSKEKQFIHEFKGFKILRLPYLHGEDNWRQLSMYFLLPDAKDGLPELVQNIGSVPGLLDSNFSQQGDDDLVGVGDFKIPKFKFSFGFEASKMLLELGLGLLFSEPDFSGMVELGGQDLSVSGVYHKSFIEVNEEGTEAAASSAVVIKESAKRPSDFVADHPFLFLIRDDVSGAVLFIGQVLDPLKN